MSTVDEERVNEIRERLRRYKYAVEFDEEREAVLADLYDSYVKDVGWLLERLAGDEQERA